MLPTGLPHITVDLAVRLTYTLYEEERRHDFMNKCRRRVMIINIELPRSSLLNCITTLYYILLYVRIQTLFIHP